MNPTGENNKLLLSKGNGVPPHALSCRTILSLLEGAQPPVDSSNFLLETSCPTKSFLVEFEGKQILVGHYEKRADQPFDLLYEGRFPLVMLPVQSWREGTWYDGKIIFCSSEEEYYCTAGQFSITAGSIAASDREFKIEKRLDCTSSFCTQSLIDLLANRFAISPRAPLLSLESYHLEQVVILAIATKFFYGQPVHEWLRLLPKYENQEIEWLLKNLFKGENIKTSNQNSREIISIHQLANSVSHFDFQSIGKSLNRNGQIIPESLLTAST